MSNQQHAQNKAEGVMRLAIAERKKIIDKLKICAPSEFQIWNEADAQVESMRKLLSETIAMRDAAMGNAKNLWKEAVAAVNTAYDAALATRDEAAQKLAIVEPDAWQKLRIIEDACRQIYRASHPNEHSQEEE